MAINPDAESPEALAERLRLTLAVSGAAGAWEWNLSTNRISGDARFANLYNISSAQALAGIAPATFVSIIHPHDQTRIRLAIGGVLRGAEVLSKEFRVILADGSLRWLHARGRREAADFTHFNGALVDVTEQKKVEERLRVAQTAGEVGTFEYIDGFGTATVSDQFCRLLGLHPATDLPVRSINALVHPDDTPIILGDRSSSSMSEGRVEFRITRPDTQEVRWLTRKGEYVSDSDSKVRRFSGVIYDITHSKLIEKKLLLLNETLEERVRERTLERDDIWRLSRDLLGIADARGVWTSVSPAWTRTLGWQQSELEGRTSHWLEDPAEKSHIEEMFTKTAFLHRLRTTDGSYRSLSWTIVPKEGLFYCVARDVTEELENARSLVEAEEQLRQSHKMEAIGQLTGGIAHDFNNLLTGITASLSLIQRRLKSGKLEDLDNFINAATTSARRAAALTHSMLAFSRRQSLDIKGQQINDILVGFEDMLRRSVSENIQLTMFLSANVWPALTDANQLANAILNLVINSRDAMADGGEICVETSNVSLDANAAKSFKDMQAGDYVRICVSDTGSGMPAEVIGKAFDPFFTTKPIGQGTGLGLSMIYGFAKQCGGHVDIQSKVGQGTEVSLYLPRAALSEKRPVTPAATSPVARGRTETVLVVEDDPTVRLIITEVLDELGYKAIVAGDAHSALPHLKSDQPIHLLVTDVGLPQINGRELAEMARVYRPSLKVLFITGYTEKATIREDFLSPGMDLLTKPFELDALGAKIRELIDGDRSH